MKYGMNLLLWTTHVTSELFPLLGQLKRAGYDGVELPLFEGDAAARDTLRSSRRVSKATSRFRSSLWKCISKGHMGTGPELLFSTEFGPLCQQLRPGFDQLRQLASCAHRGSIRGKQQRFH